MRIASSEDSQPADPSIPTAEQWWTPWGSCYTPNRLQIEAYPMTNPKNCGCGCVVKKKKHWPVWSFCLLFICFLIELQLRWLFPIRTSDCAICSGHPTSSAENLFVFHGSTLPTALGQLLLSSRFLGSKVGKTVADTVPKPLFWASEVPLVSWWSLCPTSNAEMVEVEVHDVWKIAQHDQSLSGADVDPQFEVLCFEKYQHFSHCSEQSKLRCVSGAFL